ALAGVPWLDEAIARREWRRLVRQMAAGRWTGLFVLFVLALWLPALAIGSYPSSTNSDLRWPFASLGIASCVGSMCTGFLLTPLPHLLGLTDHPFWASSIMARLACPLPAAVTTALLACGYLGLTAHLLRLSEQGFRSLRADPERLERRPERVEEVVEPGSE